ncbi:MAG: MFS transporter [Holophagae bacterium]|nr:MAG: MFS transporter [Holophagae bacterium]
MSDRGRETGRRAVISWALYDWANSAFATVMMAGFFPIFFRDVWSAGEASADITFRLGLANSIASLVIVALGPSLGAIADRGGRRKRFLMAFQVLGVTTTGALTWVALGRWELALVLFVLSTVGFLGANVFYDALIVSVTSEDRYDVVSALGYALGYLGGGVLFAGCVATTMWPAAFGLAGTEQAVRLSFLLTAIWWAVFSIPLFLFVREQGATARSSLVSAVRGGLSQLAATFRELRGIRTVGLFLLAYWLYIDGVDTIIRMAVDYGMALGFGRTGLILALLITQFVGFPAAIAFGRIGARLGAKNGILIGIGVYVGVTVWAFFMDSVWEFYALAVTIGLVQGGVQALSRSFYARLIPPEKSAEFFGFYNMLGKFAAVIGPLLMGWVGVATGNPRLAILSIVVLFLGGGALLLCVRGNPASQAQRSG